MKRLFFLFFALLFSFSIVYAQAGGTYWGHIHHYPVRFEWKISKQGDISGTCTYLKFRSVIPLEGTLASDSTFTLYERVDGKKNATLSGRMKAGRLTGNWKNERKSYPFLLKSEASDSGLKRFFQEPYVSHGTTRQLEVTDSLFTTYWEYNPFEEIETIESIDQQILVSLEELLRRPETAGYDWEFLLEINTLRSADHNLCLLGWEENQSGTFRMHKCVIQYRDHNGNFGVKPHDSGFAYHEIDQLSDREEPVYLLIGAARTCGSCLSDIAEMVRIEKGGLETDFGGFQFTEWDYESNRKTISFKGSFSTYYRFDDFVDFSYDPRTMELHYAYIQNSHDLYNGDLSEKSAEEEAFDILIEGTLRFQGTTFKEVFYNEKKLSPAEADQLRE